LAAAEALAALGANLAIVGRSKTRTRIASARIRAAAGGGATVATFIADLSSQAAVRRLAAEVLARYPKLDVLINNAGAMYGTRQLTKDGIELTWAVNHLAPFLLSKLLLQRRNRRNHKHGVKDARAATIEPNEQGTIGPMQMRSTGCALPQNIEVMPQYNDFGFQLLCDLKQSHNMRTNRRPIAIMRRSCSDSPLTASDMDGVFGSDKGYERHSPTLFRLRSRNGIDRRGRR
jgi:hypothetical protein